MGKELIDRPFQIMDHPDLERNPPQRTHLRSRVKSRVAWRAVDTTVDVDAQSITFAVAPIGELKLDWDGVVGLSTISGLPSSFPLSLCPDSRVD